MALPCRPRDATGRAKGTTVRREAERLRDALRSAQVTILAESARAFKASQIRAGDSLMAAAERVQVALDARPSVERNGK